MSHAAPSDRKCGVLLSDPKDGGRVVESELIQCCHCQYTAVWRPGSEKGWALCTRCRDFHCAKTECQTCVPIRQQCDNLHDGKGQYHTAPSVVGGFDKAGGGIILG